MIKKIHHIGIVVRNIEEAFGFYKDTLGLPLGKMATIQDQGVRAALLPIGESEIELLEPVNPDSGVARFLEKKGGGLHHLCFETDNIETELQGAKNKGVKVIDQKPRPGLAGIIAFLHPQACCSVLVEYAQPVDHSEHASLLGEARDRRFTAKRLDHVVIAVKDLEAAVSTYQKNFGLTRESPAQDVPALGIRNTFLPISDSKIEIVEPLGEKSPIAQFIEKSGEGMYLLSLDVDYLPGAVQVFAEKGIKANVVKSPTSGDIAFISPKHTHGVLLQLVSRR
ncbi:MAG: methylmalonyl-CoA epimerase [Candidatus Binatia bacterium]